jgi:hypothetical protein
MSPPRQKFWIKLLRQTKGSTMLEFAFVSGLLLLIVMAILDFGHAWFLRQVIINASREGARYAVIYRVDATTGERLKPNQLVYEGDKSLIEKTVKDNLFGIPAEVVVSGAGYSSGVAGEPVIVTVTTKKDWFAVHEFVKLFGGDLGKDLPMNAATTMRVE